MRQSDKELPFQRGIARVLQPERREADHMPSFPDELYEFGSEPGMAEPALRRTRVESLMKR